jgi:purine-binding chemotaxis protein CheW
MTTHEPTSGTASLAGKYLTFHLGQEAYGISVLNVREIIRQTTITAVPEMPSYVKGVINLRGKIIPVLHLKQKSGLGDDTSAEAACIVVVQVQVQGSGGAVQLGLIVDAVDEVSQVAASEIESAPEFGVAVDTSFILGMAKVKGAVKTVLDIDQIVGAHALGDLQTGTALDSGSPENP